VEFSLAPSFGKGGVDVFDGCCEDLCSLVLLGSEQDDVAIVVIGNQR
jgi:hypothetical protein